MKGQHMNKLIVAALFVISSSAFAYDTGKKEQAPAAGTAAQATATAAAPATTETGATHAHSKVTKEDAEKACKAEKAKDLKKCVADKTHMM
jgi:cytochrome bd-type quinol oxidase subunit 1